MSKKQDDGLYFYEISDQEFCIEEHRFYHKRHDTILLNSVKALFILNGSACLALIAFYGQFTKIHILLP